jgi:hypothetical protein
VCDTLKIVVDIGLIICYNIYIDIDKYIKESEVSLMTEAMMEKYQAELSKMLLEVDGKLLEVRKSDYPNLEAMKQWCKVRDGLRVAYFGLRAIRYTYA